MGFAVDHDDVDALVDLIKSAGIASVSDEAAEVDAPGVWVQATGYTFNRAAGYTLNTRIVLMVPDSEPRKARRKLATLLNKVLTVVSPAGPVEARTVLLPGDDPALLPGLAFPLNPRITVTEEP